jgi:hypothetical protein
VRTLLFINGNKLSSKGNFCLDVKSKNGKDLVFTILFNNYTCKNSEIRKICEEVIVKMAELN